MSRRLILCAQPRSSNWGVALPASGSVVLIGWSEIPPPVDGGMPDWVAKFVADALTARHTATFPSTSNIVERAEHVKDVRLHGFQRFVHCNGPRDFKLVSTRDTELVRCAFDDPGFPWSMQEQFVLLSPVDAPVPQLDVDDVIRMIAPTANDLDAWSCANATAQVRAGVDGDLAAIFSVSALVEAQLIVDCERAAVAAGLDLRRVTEPDFEAALADDHTS